MHWGQTKQVTRSQTANGKYTVLLPVRERVQQGSFSETQYSQRSQPTVATTKASETGRGSVQD